MRDPHTDFQTSISLTRGSVVFRIESKEMRFRPDEIQIVGEFSAPRGAYYADYFFVFKIAGYENLLEVPAYTEGLFEVMADLKPFLDGLKNPRLQMSSEYESNVLFPAEYEGQPLYSFRAELKPWINLPMIRNLVWVETMVKELNPVLVGN